MGWDIHESRGKSGKASGAIATHLRLSAIAIVVAHAKVGNTLGGFHGQKAVRPDPTVSVAESLDRLAVE